MSENEHIKGSAKLLYGAAWLMFLGLFSIGLKSPLSLHTRTPRDPPIASMGSKYHRTSQLGWRISEGAGVERASLVEALVPDAQE